MIQLEDTLAQVRKEYEMLRIEFEQTLAANEQAGMMILAPPCSLPHMPALCGYLDSLVLSGAQMSERPLSQSLEFLLAHSLGVCFSAQIGQFCCLLLRRNLSFGNCPHFSEVPDVFCTLPPCAFALITVLHNIAIAVFKAP